MRRGCSSKRIRNGGSEDRGRGPALLSFSPPRVLRRFSFSPSFLPEKDLAEQNGGSEAREERLLLLLFESSCVGFRSRSSRANGFSRRLRKATLRSRCTRRCLSQQVALARDFAVERYSRGAPASKPARLRMNRCIWRGVVSLFLSLVLPFYLSISLYLARQFSAAARGSKWRMPREHRPPSRWRYLGLSRGST